MYINSNNCFRLRARDENTNVVQQSFVIRKNLLKFTLSAVNDIEILCYQQNSEKSSTLSLSIESTRKPFISSWKWEQMENAPSHSIGHQWSSAWWNPLQFRKNWRNPLWITFLVLESEWNLIATLENNWNTLWQISTSKQKCARSNVPSSLARES